MEFRVIDTQVLLDASSEWRYSRILKRVNQPSALNDAAQIAVMFDPSYQTLTLHHLRVVRGRDSLDRLDRNRVNLLQREQQLENRLYDGRVTASIVIEDVRAGDEIDFAYSVRGANPVFQGRYSDDVWMASDRGPTGVSQFRLLAPTTRAIHYKTGSPAISVQSRVIGAQRETTFRRQAIAALRFEPGARSQDFLGDQVQLSEFRDWNEVAKWGNQLFVPPAGASPKVDAKAAEMKLKGNSPEERLLETLKFVQTEIRYFGTEMGASSHRPAAPETVLAQRFGDCKDKVMLLSALLRPLGIAAIPVLVSTRYREDVDQLLPGPLAFDHVIARVELNGQSYWMDPTRNHQTGALAHRQVTELRKGLLLEQNAVAMTRLPAGPDRPHMSVEDIFLVESFSGDVRLDSRITYHGILAERVLAAMSAMGQAAFDADSRRPYTQMFPKLKVREPLKIDSSGDRNTTTLIQSFTISDIWKYPDERTLVAEVGYWSLFDTLRIPGETTRQQSFALPEPGVYTHRVEFNYPEPVYERSDAKVFTEGNGKIAFRSSMEGGERNGIYTAELKILKDHVLPSEWETYRTTVLKVAPRLGFGAAVSAIPLTQQTEFRKEMVSLGQKMQSGSIRLKTKTQEEAWFKIAVASAQIGGGRLSAPWKAKALLSRAIAKDNLGRFAEARLDYDAALSLQPEDRDILLAAAVNAGATGDSHRTNMLTDKILKATPTDSEVWLTRARASFVAKNYSAAEHQLLEALKDRAQIRRGFPLLLLYLAAGKQGKDGRQAMAPYLTAELPDGWPRPLIDYAAGKRSAVAALKDAREGEDSAKQQTEAYFYIGHDLLTQGQDRNAREHFQNAMKQGITEYFEHQAASAELTVLSARR
ncbi:MAG: DUF3857 domain-containing protein [Panacagrimonas sp.]